MDYEWFHNGDSLSIYVRLYSLSHYVVREKDFSSDPWVEWMRKIPISFPINVDHKGTIRRALVMDLLLIFFPLVWFKAFRLRFRDLEWDESQRRDSWVASPSDRAGRHWSVTPSGRSVLSYLRDSKFHSEVRITCLISRVRLVWWPRLWRFKPSLRSGRKAIGIWAHSGDRTTALWMSDFYTDSSLRGWFWMTFWFSDDCFVLRFVYEFVGLALCSVVWESIRTGCSMFFFQFAVLNLLFRLAFSLSEVAPHSLGLVQPSMSAML